MNGSLLDLLNHGGGSMWVIVAFSVIALAVAIERLIAQWKFHQRASELAETVGRCLRKGAVDDARTACERSPSPLADVFLVGFERFGREKAEHVATAVHRERVRVLGHMKVRLWILATLGATAPFVGLFGTIVGMMSALGGFQGREEVPFSSVSGPISEALVVTAAGIVVAVEAVILYNYFNQRGARIATDLKLRAEEFLEQLLEREGQGGDSKPAAKKEGRDGDREAA